MSLIDDAISALNLLRLLSKYALDWRCGGKIIARREVVKSRRILGCGA